MPSTPPLRIAASARKFWRERVEHRGLVRGSWEFVSAVLQFLRDSTPSRLRSRFGDADYDWEYRVNTTSGAVGWRERLLGVFNSPYQPTERELFHEMIDALAERAAINFADFTFLDLGSGKGRALLLASDYPLRRIIGVELLPALHEIAQQNLANYRSELQKCFVIESICADATDFALPEEPLVIYLFNPFPEAGLRRFLGNLQKSLEASPRPVYIVYHNPQLESVFNESERWTRIAATHQYSIFAAAN